MRLSRYFLLLFLITFFSLLYTHQQFIIIRANYNIGTYENQFSHLLDRNKKLMYNVTALESPANLEAKLDATGIDYDVPMQWTVVKRLKSEGPYNLAGLAERRNVVIEGILNFLAMRAEAQSLED